MSEAKILFPVGRYVGGSLYRSSPVLENDNKTPKLNSAGQPRKSYSFALAIRKAGPGARWEDTPWGAKIKQVAVEAFPNGEYNAPAFAWKIVDGDSAVPNKKGKKPCDNEGWPGHHIVWFSSEAQAPKLTDKFGTREGTLQYADGVERIKPGHMIEVLGFITDNKPSQSPGVYMNYDMVAHNDATTPEITLRAQTDSTTVGFGGGAAPAPVAPAPVAPAPVAPPAAPTHVQPNTAYMQAPAAPAAPQAPQAPAAPAAPVGPQMTAAATTTYEAYRAGGWTDEQLRQHGLMV